MPSKIEFPLRLGEWSEIEKKFIIVFHDLTKINFSRPVLRKYSKNILKFQ